MGQQSAAQVYDDYLQLDADQNGMLSASELARWRDGGLTTHFVARLFQEVNTYPNKDGMQNEMDYKLYLDFVLANMYKTTNEALQYHFRMLDLHKTGRLTVFEVNYFFRPVIERLHEMKYYEEKQKLPEDVVDEIFDMVKPKECV